MQIFEASDLSSDAAQGAEGLLQGLSLIALGFLDLGHVVADAFGCALVFAVLALVPGAGLDGGVSDGVVRTVALGLEEFGDGAVVVGGEEGGFGDLVVAGCEGSAVADFRLEPQWHRFMAVALSVTPSG
ncbi:MULTISPECIES: hypothetical protein [unclassified Streptomyces]|uniref:hypothetical protein n=1 Tax=unclassified Streptomyces TaxID=2593676 RepID=UPI003C7BB94D